MRETHTRFFIAVLLSHRPTEGGQEASPGLLQFSDTQTQAPLSGVLKTDLLRKRTQEDDDKVSTGAKE